MTVYALPTPVSSPDDPELWLRTLSAQLSSRRSQMQKMDAYYRGEHPLPFLTKAHESKMRDQFRQLLEDSRSNFMRLVVDVVEERLRVDGFRLSAANDQQADGESWDIWQANQMDALSQLAFVEALVKGVSYISVWGDTDNDEYPDIAVEDPLETIVAYVPGSNFRKRAAALKLWEDSQAGLERANVYLPAGIWKYERPLDQKKPIGTQPGLRTVSAADPMEGWKALEGDEFVDNPLGVVPIVPLRNRPRPLCEGESELCDVFRIQNQINGFNFLLALAGYFGAHRQKWVTGLAATLDERGNAVEPFKTAVDTLFHAEDADVRFGQFDETNLDGYLKATEQKVEHIAITTRTPKHYLLPEGQEPSGDAIKSAEAGLIHRVQRAQRTFGEGLEEVLNLARKFAGDGETAVDSEVVWADAQIRTEAEITDAAIKRFQAGITPWEQTAEDLGYSQTQIARMLETFGGVAPQAAPKPAPLEEVPPPTKKVMTLSDGRTATLEEVPN